MNLLHELWALHPGFPPLRPAFGLVDLYHKEGQDHHGPQEGEHGNGLAHLLIVAARHDPCKRTAGDIRNATAPSPTRGRLIGNERLANIISRPCRANIIFKL